MTQPRIISKTSIGNQRLSRVQLASGERVLIKVVLGENYFLRLSELGSMNPITIAVDWLLGRFLTGNRTGGVIDIWGLGHDAVTREVWRATIQFTFGHEGTDEEILTSVADVIMYSPSVPELRRRLELVNTKLNELGREYEQGQ